MIPGVPSPSSPVPRPGCPARLLAACAAALALTLAAPTPAGAIGLYQDGAGGRAAGMAGAGTAVADDPLSALFNNPAALADLGPRPQAQLGVTGGFVDGYFHNRANRDADLDGVGLIGNTAATLPVGPVTLGLGFNPDIGATVTGRYNDAPGGADGATTYGFRRNASELILLRGALGAGYKLAPNCFIGLTIGLLYNVNKLDTNFVFQDQKTLRTVKTRLDLDTDGFGYNFQAGLRWRPVPSVALNVSYTSRSQVESYGRATGNARRQLFNLGLGAARPDFAYDARVTNDFPQIVNAGLAWQPPQVRGLTLAAQFDWIEWSQAFNDLPVRLRNGNNADLNGLVGASKLADRVPLRWRDQYTGRVGAEYLFGEHWAVRGGYAYSTHPVPDSTLTPLTPVLAEHLLTLGGSYRVGRVRIDAAYQWQLPATGRVAGRSALLAGEYDRSVTSVQSHVFTLSATVSF